jgi:2-polyprenyl-3-methyl-5-hydroxy-6-metoxy-1,4-benzoquinol methylase
MSENLSPKVFANYLNTGFGEQNKAENFKHSLEILSAFYNWNYRELLPDDKNIKILDIGCGMGQFLSWLKSNGYKNFFGIDLSQQMVDFCRKNVTANAQKVESIKEFLQDKNNTYDLIVMLDVIEHISKPDILEDLAVIFKALKKGGKLLIKTNNLASITGSRMRYEDFTHLTGYTEYSLKQVLKIVGFKQIEIRPYAIPRINFKRWLRFILQTLLHWCWKLTYFMEFTAVPKIVDEFIYSVAIKE